MLNSTQAREIFDKYSFLYGMEDVMPAVKATDLFGEEAVLYAIQALKKGVETIASLKIDNGHPHICLTYAGLQMAVTYCNRQEIIERDRRIYVDGIETESTGGHEAKESGKIISFSGRRKQA